jgi:prophage tail gpP-like protein
MPKRPDRDVVTLESVDGGDASVLIDRCTQYEICNDLMSPSAARFELGDEQTWEALRPVVAIGSRYVVSVNGQARLKGRLLTRNLALSASSGGTVQLGIRTLLADAMFTAVNPKIGVTNTTLLDVILAAFKPMGITISDLVIGANLARDLLTGRTSAKKAAPEVKSLQIQEARPHPPETIFGFIDRHLSRFGLMMWDTADGRIAIGAPDDGQEPLYQMTARRGAAAQANNLLSATKVEDFEEVPAQLWVYGLGAGGDILKSRVKFVQLDTTLYQVDPPLRRQAIVIDESLHTQAQAEARARREMMRRSLQKDSWSLITDGFAYWDGSSTLPYVIDTVADVQVDIAGGANGAYLLYQVRMTGSAEQGHITSLTTVGKGIFQL